MARVNAYKRGKTWTWQFEGAGIGGKRKQYTKGGFRTKAEALKAGGEAYRSYNACGKAFTPTDMSVADYMEYRFGTYAEKNFRHKTLEGYRGILDRHIIPKLGIYRLSALSPLDCQAFADALRDEGYSLSMMGGVVGVLSEALRYAVVPLGLIASSPAEYVRIPKSKKPARTRTPLTMEQWKEIISLFPEGNRFHVPLMLGFHLGIRIGECFGLTWDDVDLDARSIRIHQQASKRYNDGWYLCEPKTETSNRVVYFDDCLRGLLMREKARQARNEELYGEYYTCQHVLLAPEGKKILSAQVCMQSSLPRVRLVNVDENGEMTSCDSFKYVSRKVRSVLHLSFDYHTLRHTHATMLAEAGVDVKSLQQRLGHRNVNTTLQVYTHPTESQERNAVEKFERLVNG